MPYAKREHCVAARIRHCCMSDCSRLLGGKHEIKPRRRGTRKTTRRMPFSPRVTFATRSRVTPFMLRYAPVHGFAGAVPRRPPPR
ncbi:hypothetical protein RHRU231_590004 [Rhodococcus ruber]|uniref:Uncharacterized protein n=1 Tax=Rhodococcus ruber TaxID=1830 RepID=A0A098BNT4_9NOCA|nr:hypothetical protein RHRU231_590004 [Rhodococcus ruber]